LENWLFVRVETDEGIHGIGEGTLGHLLGRDAFQIESMVARWMREIFADGVPREKDQLTWTPKLVDGHLEIPTAPGLGADLILEMVEAHPYHTAYGQWLWNNDWQFRRTHEATGGVTSMPTVLRE
jgi:L-alanine-DL-glutamate epimerase-like enolase superfamily enzyme